MLKRLAKLRGISETELIRQAIDREIEHGQFYAAQYDHSAWDGILKLVEARKQLDVTGAPYQWNRQEIYAERDDFEGD